MGANDFDVIRKRPLTLKSTRSGETFDGFDVNEELARARRIMLELGEEQPELSPDCLQGNAAFMFGNIHAWIVQGGALPDAWRKRRK